MKNGGEYRSNQYQPGFWRRICRKHLGEIAAAVIPAIKRRKAKRSGNISAGGKAWRQPAGESGWRRLAAG